MDKTVLFWIIAGCLAFAMALAVQMRVLVALVLRRALTEKYPDLGRVNANAAVIFAAGRADLPANADEGIAMSARHLREVYPRPLAHLGMARRVSIAAPIMLLVWLVIGRFALEVF